MKARIKITQTRVKFYDLDTDGYDSTVSTIEEAIEVEKKGASEYHEYMDDAEEENFTFEIVEENKKLSKDNDTQEVYIVIRQTEITNMISEVFTNRNDAEKSLSSDINRDNDPYIEVHRLQEKK